MKIRSITCFLHPGWPVDDEKIQQVGTFLQSANSDFAAAGYEVQTTRLAAPAFAGIVNPDDGNEVVEFAVQMEDAALRNGIDYLSIGPALPSSPASFEVIPDVIRATQNVFAGGLMTTDNGEVCLASVRACAHVIHRAARLDEDGFSNLRFAALANVPPGAPFFPAAYARAGAASENVSFSIANQAADLALEAFQEAHCLSDARGRLVTVVEHHAKRLSEIAGALEKRFGITFGGIDFTLAPFPQPELSLGTALEDLGVPAVGKHGSLAAVAFLADALDRARYLRAGFNGVMLPVMEDSVLAARVADGHLNIGDLLLYSTVCGTGLDTVPLPGDTSIDELYAVLLDVAMLSLRLNKPLTARLMPIPGKSAGDPTDFDFPYFANSSTMPVKAGVIQGLLAGNEQIEMRE